MRSMKSGTALAFRTSLLNNSRAALAIAKVVAITSSSPVESKRKTMMKQISKEYHQNLRGRLTKNKGAMAYLTGLKCGLDAETIKYFGLGLSFPYPKDSNNPKSDAVVAPMISQATGQFLNRSAYLCVPGVTQNPIDSNGWMRGSAQTYYAGIKKNQRFLFVCGGFKDVWRHWQALSKVGLTDDILLISSTHGSAIPAEWRSEEFWKPWQAVYLGQGNDDAGCKTAEDITQYAGREVRRIEVPKELGNDWTDYWQCGADIEDFRELLDKAPTASGAKIASDELPPDPASPRLGRFSYKPVDINGAFVGGHLYYPTETLEAKFDKDKGRVVERLETIVIRSDRTTHRAQYAPAPDGTPLSRRVLKITDGTIIEKLPRASSARTWDYESIEAYLNRQSKTRNLAAILEDILAALQQAVWLPYEEDYVALALAVPVTYVQMVFESVPLLLLNGPAASGKTQTGTTMAKLCCNGCVIGQVSAASAARLIDETRGFVVLDDVEAIAAKANKDPQVSDFVQALKVSYNQQTGIKVWTDVKTMRTERLNFFGVKLLSNTLGADAILGSRMVRIQTRKMPDRVVSTVRDFTVEDLRNLHRLRNELHTWAFENVGLVEKTYRQVYTNKTDRQAEIAAPLRTMAQLCGDPELTAKLETCLARQHLQERNLNEDTIETLKEAVRNLIKQGFDTVTLTHLQLEMHALLDANYGMSSTTDIPEWDRPEWLGRQLRSNDLVADGDLGRRRIYGKNLRLVKFADWVLKETTHENGKLIYITNKQPEAFCQGCASCPYRNAGCDLMALRAREEGRHRKMANVN
jgi:hypothetical protein